MSLFAPMDPRGPDARRKALMAKLSQQRGGSVPMPARAGGAMGPGSAFRGLGNFRPPATHNPNVGSSILQRLGIGGVPGQGEFSPGQGEAIGYGGGVGDPFSQTPTPITGGTPIAPPAAPQPPVGPPPVQDPSVGSTDPGTFGSQPTSGGDLPRVQGPSAASALPGGMIDLGNGLVYDSLHDRVIQQPSAQNADIGARGLYRM